MSALILPGFEGKIALHINVSYGNILRFGQYGPSAPIDFRAEVREWINAEMRGPVLFHLHTYEAVTKVAIMSCYAAFAIFENERDATLFKVFWHE